MLLPTVQVDRTSRQRKHKYSKAVATYLPSSKLFPSLFPSVVTANVLENDFRYPSVVASQSKTDGYLPQSLQQNVSE